MVLHKGSLVFCFFVWFEKFYFFEVCVHLLVSMYMCMSMQVSTKAINPPETAVIVGCGAHNLSAWNQILVLCRSTKVILASLNHQLDKTQSHLRREVNLDYPGQTGL